MKIISNFKDYYDYMVGKYGRDDKIIYARITEQQDFGARWHKGGIYTPNYLKFGKDRYEHWEVAFCGRLYQIYYLFGHWFFGNQALSVDLKRYPLKQGHTPYYSKDDWQGSFGHDRGRHKDSWGRITTMNDELNCPVVLTSDKIKNPRLKDINFAKVIPAEDAFIYISNWLSREKVISDNRTDKEKVLSHGFDVKTSFRKM